MAIRIPLSGNFRQQLITSWRLLTVSIGFALIGWLMNGLGASSMACFGTLVVSCYLIWVGSGGVALASVWVVGLMSIAAINQQWFHEMPRPEFRIIPMTLLASWLLVLVIVWWVGKICDGLRTTKLPKMLVFSGWVGLVLVGLVFGWRLYPETLLFIAELK